MQASGFWPHRFTVCSGGARLVDMEAWLGLGGALIGGLLTITGQYVLVRINRAHERSKALVSCAAQLVALSEEYRDRLWEERRIGASDRLSEWRLSDYRKAEASLKILDDSERLRSTLQAL